MTFRSVLLAAAAIILPIGAANAQAIDGLYVGGGAGVNIMQPEDFKLKVPAGSVSGSASTDVGPIVVLSLGWGFGNGFRAELEGSWRQNNGFSNSSSNGSKFASFGGDEQKIGVMFNALYDFVDALPVVTPYVGVGLGYQRVIDQNLRGAIPGASFTASNSSKGGFAYQAILGAAMPLPSVPGLALTLEYRFMGIAGDRTYSGQSGTGVPVQLTASNDFNHSILVGVRYAFGQAPPPAAPMPVADTGAKTFLVFFDWNKADLTARSEGIVRDAAAYSTKTQYTRIDVDGNTDTSGTPTYNQGLSERRARVVAAELVRDGVPQAAISMHAYGETKLLVPTGPNTREPQNRRVEIVFH